MEKNRIRRIMRFVLTVVAALLLSGCIPAGNVQTAPKTPAKTGEVQDIPELSLTGTPGRSQEDEKSASEDAGYVEAGEENVKESGKENTKDSDVPEDTQITPEKKQDSITEDGIYHDLESVVLYYDKFGHLPANFITKKEAKDLGWEGGKLDPYVKGGSIGGDHFGNYEKRLPTGRGIRYIECDIDTAGGRRGAKRLIISNDGRYYYTPDHYDSFREVVVEDGDIAFAD